MTSLAGQLRRLAVPHTQAVLAPDKRRVSLLFNPKDAAELDRQAVYAIGISGLEELEEIDPEFSEYHNSLFNLSSQNWERTLQTREVNTQLDETIAKFLIRLSPYFLLAPAHKTLEWLIYRYHIHQMNIDAIIGCVLPYHETNIFVRVIQLLPIQSDKHKWNWLYAGAKAGVVLPRSSLINHCRGDPAFLSIIAELPVAFGKEHGWESGNLRTVIALWTCTLLGVIPERTQVTERVMGVLVPGVTRGLKSKSEDWKAGAYMVVAQLASDTVLQAEFVSTLLRVFTKSVSPKLSKEALLCLALIVKTQKVEKLTKKCVKRLITLPAVVQTLALLSKQYDISALVSLLLHRLIPSAISAAPSVSSSSDDDTDHVTTPQYDVTLCGLLSDIPLGTDMATELTIAMFQELLKSRANRPEEEWKSASRSFLSILQTRYSVSFDLAVDFLAGGEGGRGKTEGGTKGLPAKRLSVDPSHLQDVLQAASGGIRGEVCASTSLYLALNHVTPNIRLLALEHVKKNFQNLAEQEEEEEEGAEKGELVASLLDRMNDDTCEVAVSALQLDREILKTLPKKKLTDNLIKIIRTKHTPGKDKEMYHAVQLLCQDGVVDPEKDHIGVRLLPSLILDSPRACSVDALKVLFESKLATMDPILKAIVKRPKDWLSKCEQLLGGEKGKGKFHTKALDKVVISAAAQSLVKLNTEKRKQLLSMMLAESQEDVRYQFVAVRVLQEALKLSGDEAGHEAVLLEIASHLFSLVSNTVKEETTGSDEEMGRVGPASMLPAPGVSHLPLGAVGWALQSIVHVYQEQLIKLPQCVWWESHEPCVQLLVSVLDVLVSISCTRGKDALVLPWRHMVQSITEKVLDQRTMPCLAALLWTQHVLPESDVSTRLQVAAPHLVANSWKHASANELVHLLEGHQSPALPGLLVCLGSEDEELRKGAIVCVKTLRKAGNKNVGKLNALFKKINHQKEEIEADASHIQNILCRLLPKDAEVQRLVLHWITDNQTPDLFKHRLLHLLQTTTNAVVLDAVLPIGEHILEQCDQTLATPTQVLLLSLVLERLGREQDAPTMSCSSPRLQLLLKALHTKAAPLGSSLPAALAMNQVTLQVFHALPGEEERKAVVSAILDITEKGSNANLTEQVNITLKHVQLQLEHVCHELTLSEGEANAAPTTVKSRRHSRGSAKPVSWRRITTLLEVLQNCKKMKQSEEMVARLFPLLNQVQLKEGDEWEYRQRLILAIIQKLTQKWQKLQITPKQESVNVESLVRTVRNPTCSMQTKQHALAVMANLAHFFPEHLLHHVMSVFTFVGEGLMAADDEHSLAVVSSTITTIIPALLSAENTADKQTNQLINQIVQVFVDAQRSVPRHRSLTVFTTLVTTLGAEDSLWRILTLLVATATQLKDNQPQEDGLDNTQELKSLERDMEFGLSVCGHFDLDQLVVAATKVVLFLQWLSEQHARQQTDPKTQRNKGVKGKQKAGADGGAVSTVVDVSTLTPHQLRLLQFHLTRLVSRMLSNEELVAKVVEQKDLAGSMFHQFVQDSVMYMLTVARLHQAVSNPQHVRFWKTLMGKAYEILDKVLYLLPTPVLLDVVSTLLSNDLPGVKRKSLDLLASKLQALLVTPPSAEEEKSLLRVLDDVMEIAMETTTSGNDSDVSAIRQLALYDVKLLCKVIGGNQQTTFLTVLKRVMTLVVPDGTPAVVGSAMLVEAEVVAVVRAQAIPHLPQITNPLLQMLNEKDIVENELVLMCGLTALHRLVATLPHFLSPYLKPILNVVCHLSATSGGSDKSQADLRLAAIRHLLSTVVAARVLVPALHDTFSDVINSPSVSKVALSSVMSMCKEHVEALSKDDLTSQHTPLLNLFTSALDLRTTNKHLSGADVSAVEKCVIEAVMAMVVRLSEASFRPMFYKLYDWACREDTPQNRLRKLTFFNLADSLAAKLRGLFNLFVGHALQAACTILTANNSLTGEVSYFGSDGAGIGLSCEVVSSVLASLTKCMSHDTEGLFSGDVFNMLLQPIVDQIENFVGSEEDYEARMSQRVVPCLSQFIVAAKEDSHQKSLNYQVLLKARHVSAKVRFGALRVISGMASQMGDEYVVLLPETIPFLAELMEDESEEVERECQQVISNLEGVLGESLQKYF